MRNGVKRSAFKGGGCRADSCLCAPASLNECCAFILLMVSAWRGSKLGVESSCLLELESLIAWYCFNQQAIL